MTRRTLLVSLICLASTSCTSPDAPPAHTPPASESASTLQRRTMIQDPESLGVGRHVEFPDFVLVDGKSIPAADVAKERAAVVFVMTSTGCPLSTKYAPRIAAMEAEYSKRNVGFVYVNTVAAETPDQMLQQIREQNFKGVYLPDRDQAVARKLGARTTTEVYVFNPAYTLAYRGAVDDQFGVGTALDAPTRQFLRDAIDAVLVGDRPKVGATWAPGCLLDYGTIPDKPAKDVTYLGRIARIIDTHCTECHRPNGIAPFSLAGYQEIQGRASMLEAVVKDRLMPPSHGLVRPSDQPSPFINDRTMPAADVEDLLAWLKSSRPVGDFGDAPIVRDRPLGWSIGNPDLLLSAGALKLPVDGPLMYGRYIVPTNVEKDQWVSAIEFKPVKPDSIHHALVWLLPPGAIVPALEETPTNLELIGVYSPGQQLIRYNAGVARRLPAGSLLLVDMYARPMGRQMHSSLRIAMQYATQAPTREVNTLTLAASSLKIPPGEPVAVNSASLTLDRDERVLSLTPYMRARGKTLRLETRGARAGNADILLDAARYDYRWQMRYEYAEPRTLVKGTRLIATGVHDNSLANANNPDAAAAVQTGPHTGEEAMFVAIEVERPVTR